MSVPPAQAFACFAEMKAEGQPPTAATYEMLIRGCTLAMVRVTPEEPEPDRLTLALYNRVLELWSEMRARKIRVDRYTYTELMRACGKAGQLDAAFALFFKMLSLPQFLPDERAFDSMCARVGAPPLQPGCRCAALRPSCSPALGNGCVARMARHADAP